MVLSDDEIERLLKMPKRVTNPGARKKAQKGSLQVTYDVEGDGARFQLFWRQNQRIKNNFSCGLLYFNKSGDKATLTRYNGSDHPHSNPLDKQPKMETDFHIHRATQRYMEAGRKSEHFATPTDRYTTVDGALHALLTDCNIEGLGRPESPNQILLFDNRDD